MVRLADAAAALTLALIDGGPTLAGRSRLIAGSWCDLCDLGDVQWKRAS